MNKCSRCIKQRTFSRQKIIAELGLIEYWYSTKTFQIILICQKTWPSGGRVSLFCTYKGKTKKKYSC